MSAPLARDTAELMAGLDRHRTARGSAEIYDALITGTARDVSARLGEAPRHPLTEEICAWLLARGVEPPRPPSTDEILARLGIVDIEATLTKKDAEIVRLRKQVEVLQSRGSDALKAATGYSFTTVLLTAVAVLGWMAALGVIPIVPQMEPTLEQAKDKTQQSQPNGVGLDRIPGTGR